MRRFLLAVAAVSAAAVLVGRAAAQAPGYDLYPPAPLPGQIGRDSLPPPYQGYSPYGGPSAAPYQGYGYGGPAYGPPAGYGGSLYGPAAGYGYGGPSYVPPAVYSRPGPPCRPPYAHHRHGLVIQGPRFSLYLGQ